MLKINISLYYIYNEHNIYNQITSPDKFGLKHPELSVYKYVTFPLIKKETLNAAVVDRIIPFGKNE